MINIPRSIDRDIKVKSIERFNEIYHCMGENEVDYVKKRLPRVYKRLTLHKDAWAFRVGCFAKVLLLHTNLFENRKVTQEGKIVISALYYLCDPMDIIPDHDPDKGYYDDAIVLNEAAKRLKKVNKDLFTVIERKYAREIDGHH